MRDDSQHFAPACEYGIGHNAHQANVATTIDEAHFPSDNFLSQTLLKNADMLVDEMAGLRGADFDKRYAENELAYHIAVNDLVGNTFIPNIDNTEVKALFEAGLEIFKAHQGHAEMMVKQVTQ